MASVAVGFQFLLAWVFLDASVPKFLGLSEFARAVRNYRLVPERLVAIVAWAVPTAEAACSVALFVGVGVTVAGAIAAALLVVFALAVMANLFRGRSIDCGCLGLAAPRRITWASVARNAVLAAIAVTVAITPEAREALSTSELTAFFALAGAVVLGELLVSSWLTVTSAVNASRIQQAEVLR